MHRPRVTKQVDRIEKVPRRRGSGSQDVVWLVEPLPNILSMFPIRPTEGTWRGSSWDGSEGLRSFVFRKDTLGALAVQRYVGRASLARSLEKMQVAIPGNLLGVLREW